MAIAEACTTAWGPGWLAAEGTPVMGASSIVAATDRVTSAPRAPTLADARAARRARHPNRRPAAPAPPTVGDATAPAPPTVGPAPAPPPPPAPAPAPPTIADLAPVRPTNDVHRAGIDLDDVDEADLVPVKEVLKPRRPGHRAAGGRPRSCWC